MAKRVLNRLANRCSALPIKSLLKMKTMTKMKVMKTTTTKLTFLRNAENGPMLSSASRAVEHHPDDNDERTCRIQRKCCACTHPPIEEVSCSERSADHELVRAECTTRSSASILALSINMHAVCATCRTLNPCMDCIAAQDLMQSTGSVARSSSAQ